MTPDTPISRDAFIAHFSMPQSERDGLRLLRAGFSPVEAAALVANPHVSRDGVEYAAVLVEGGLEEPYAAIRAVWPRGVGA